jgi:hypothetical protein
MQLLPGLVWIPVYAEYWKYFPTSTFTEETLQDRLKETLKELKTGNSNQEGNEFAVTQDEEIMQQLKETTGLTG